MVRAGAADFLVVGGNDLGERVEANECCYKGGASALLEQERGRWHDLGTTGATVAGHPEGLPALGFCPSATAAVLAGKVRPLLEAGIDVTIVTQFCFDANKLLKWLARTR